MNTHDYDRRLDHCGFWRSETDWPLEGTQFTPFYLRSDGALTTDSPQTIDRPSTEYTFAPMAPVPTMGGGISAADNIIRPGAFDQRERPDFIGCVDELPLTFRHDILTFQTSE